MWTWHLWVTNYNPETTNETYTSTGTKSVTYPDAATTNIFMNRNLGAMSATPGDPMTHGMMYQWGRKDPFIGKNNWVDDGVEPLIYDAEGKSFTISKIRADETPNKGNPSNLDYSIEKPTHFIFGFTQTPNNTNYDWYTTINARAAQNDELWAITDPLTFAITKQIYDPCPAGWRVPGSGALLGLVITTNDAYSFPYSPSARGRMGSAVPAGQRPADLINGYHATDNINYNLPTDPGASATVGYWPHNGYRDSFTCNFVTFSHGFYWSSTVNNSLAFDPCWNTTSIVLANSSGRSHGLTTRCVKE
jgi:hypothetical protein